MNGWFFTSVLRMYLLQDVFTVVDPPDGRCIPVPFKKIDLHLPFPNKGRSLRFAIDHRGKAKCTIFKVTALPLRLIAGSHQGKG